MSDQIVLEFDESDRCCVCDKSIFDDDDNVMINWRILTNNTTGERRVWLWHETCGPYDMYIEIND